VLCPEGRCTFHMSGLLNNFIVDHFGDPHGPILKSKEDHYFQFMEGTFATAASFKSAGVWKFRLSHRTQANDWFQLGSSEQTYMFLTKRAGFAPDLFPTIWVRC
jgi:hypothetical protein